MAYTTIDDPSAYFQTTLWAGNGQARAITNSGNSDLQPDWIWGKNRSDSNAHWLMDSTRGVDKRLISSGSDAEDDPSTAIHTAFGSDGFSLGTNTEGNKDGDNYVAWLWKANGGTTTTNDASATSVGSLDSVYQASTRAGFSIVTYTGAGGNQTIAHGLGAIPTVIIIRRRDDAGDWTSYHAALGAEKFLRLNSNNAMGDQATYFNDTTPTSSVFTVGSAGDVNTSSGTHVAYCFTDIQGYSKFGSYEGNADANGPFIYTGFKPAFVLIKEADNANDWDLRDSARNPHNHVDTWLRPNSNDADSDSDSIEFLSNGFKIRQTSNRNNRNGGTLVYLTFAESPFVSSKGIPTTAR